MKLIEAKKIVSYILEWQMVLLSVKKRENIVEIFDISAYTLSDLIKANKIVSNSNKRAQKKARSRTENGLEPRSYNLSILIDERLIAAVYTALHYRPSGEVIALINDIGVGCVKATYERIK